MATSDWLSQKTKKNRVSSVQEYSPNNALLLAPTCEEGGADHFALLTPTDSVETDLIFCSRKQTRQGIVGHIAVNHQAVHSPCRRHQRQREHENIRAVDIALILHFVMYKLYYKAK